MTVRQKKGNDNGNGGQWVWGTTRQEQTAGRFIIGQPIQGRWQGIEEKPPAATRMSKRNVEQDWGRLQVTHICRFDSYKWRSNEIR